MLIKEYRIPFRATLEQYSHGMQQLITHVSHEENVRNRQRGAEEAIETVKRERYYDAKRDVYGVYTEKKCRVRHFLPRFVRTVVPERECVLVEKAWNSFPEHCLTVYESPFLGSSFHLSIESRYIANDEGTVTNALNLSPSEMKQREVVHLNVGCSGPVRSRGEDKREDEGDKKEKMYAYRVARLRVSAPVFGVDGKTVEEWGMRYGVQGLLVRFGRMIFEAGREMQVRDVAVQRARTGGLEERGMMKNVVERCAGLAVFARSDESNPFLA